MMYLSTSMNICAIYWLTALWIFMSLFNKLEGLRCFRCDSDRDTRCGDRFQLLPSKDTAPECIGSCAKIRATKGLMAIVHRGCVDKSKYGRTTGCFSGKFDGDSATICLCNNQNYCNHAATSSTLSHCAVVSAVVLTYLSFS